MSTSKRAWRTLAALALARLCNGPSQHRAALSTVACSTQHGHAEIVQVGCLPAEVRQCLRTGALCLGRAQLEHQIELPTDVVGQVLALAAAP